MNVVFTHFSNEDNYTTTKLDVKAMARIVLEEPKFCIKLTKNILTLQHDGVIKHHEATINNLSLVGVQSLNKRIFSEKLGKLNNFEDYTLLCTEIGSLSYINVDIQRKELRLSQYPFFVKLSEMKTDFGFFADDDCGVCLCEFDNEEQTLVYSCCGKHIHSLCHKQLHDTPRCIYCRCQMKK